MRTIKAFVSAKVKPFLVKTGFSSFDPYARMSFSQTGEDRVLASIFREQKTGFYVDIGAHHPKLYSNTHLFYLKGWRGINIDAMPGSMKLFRQYRPRDTNVEIPVGRIKKTLTYHIFSDPAVNTFSKSHAKTLEERGEHRLVDKKTLKVYPLRAVLSKYLLGKQTVDFLSVDVEGMDWEILVSFSWKAHRPSVVVVEDLTFSVERPTKSRIYKLIYNKGYSLYAKIGPSLIFIRNGFLS